MHLDLSVSHETEIHQIMCRRQNIYTLKTGTLVEDGDPILKLLRGVSHPKVQLGVGTNEWSSHMKTTHETELASIILY